MFKEILTFEYIEIENKNHANSIALRLVSLN